MAAHISDEKLFVLKDTKNFLIGQNTTGYFWTTSATSEVTEAYSNVESEGA